MKKIIFIVIIIFLGIFGYYYLTPKYNDWPIINKNPQGNTIVAFGDSLTAGYGVPDFDNYPSQLSTKINELVINMGVSGETTADALKRVDYVIQLNPKIVLITLGGNDLKKKVPAKVAFANLKKIVTKLQANGSLVVIGGLDIPYYKNDYAEDYIKFAKDNGCLLVPNVLAELFGHKDLMVDTVHPNAKGYTIMAEQFYNVIKDYL